MLKSGGRWVDAPPEYRPKKTLYNRFVRWAEKAGEESGERRPLGGGGLVHHSDRGVQYVSIKYAERLAEAGVEPSVGSVGDSYDTPSPRPSTGSTRPRRSGGAGRGATSSRSSSPRSNGSTGSTTGDCWSRSETFRRPKPKRAIMRRPRVTPWRRDLNETASGKPGAVHPALILPHDTEVFALAPVAPRSSALNKTLPPRMILATLPASLRCVAPKSHDLTPPKNDLSRPRVPKRFFRMETHAPPKKSVSFASLAFLGIVGCAA